MEEAIGPKRPATTTWRGVTAIAGAIGPFLGRDSHLHFAEGGGHGISTVNLGHERDTLAFIVAGSDGRMVYLGKPRSMTLEYIADEPAESFIIIDLDELSPSGVYSREAHDDDSEENEEREQLSEEVLELNPGVHVDRSVLDVGFLGHDENGDEIPVPDHARLVVRMFRGRLMLVTKGSLWNGAPHTYGGQQNRMTNEQIRSLLERSIAAHEDA